MSSTLCIRKTPILSPDAIRFKQPIKGIIARKYYDHDGSLGGGLITVSPKDLLWWEGVLAAGPRVEPSELRELEWVIKTLQDGNTLDMWFEV